MEHMCLIEVKGLNKQTILPDINDVISYGIDYLKENVLFVLKL